MSTNTFEILQYLLAQVAAESFLDGGDLSDEPSLENHYIQGSNNYRNFKNLRDTNRLGMTQATDVMWADFSGTWDVIRHQVNTTSGFSGTLLKNVDGTFTISFRSTESKSESDGGDVKRDSSEGANGEIGADGFAWAQILDMETFFADLTTPGAMKYSEEFSNYISSGEKIDVTGYSLGSHLAQVFNQLHGAVIDHTYTINGAGMGLVAGVPEGQILGTELAALFSLISQIIDDPAANATLIPHSVFDDTAATFGQVFGLTDTEQQKMQWFIDQDTQWRAVEDEASSIYTNALYQLAVARTEFGTTGLSFTGSRRFRVCSCYRVSDP